MRIHLVANKNQIFFTDEIIHYFSLAPVYFILDKKWFIKKQKFSFSLAYFLFNLMPVKHRLIVVNLNYTCASETIDIKMRSFKEFSAGPTDSVWWLCLVSTLIVLIEFWALSHCAVSGIFLLSLMEKAREVQWVPVIWQQTERKQNNWNSICASMWHWRQEHKIEQDWLDPQKPTKKRTKIQVSGFGINLSDICQYLEEIGTTQTMILSILWSFEREVAG